MARSALAWAAHLGDGGATVSDYEHNLRTVASSPFLNSRDLGVASSLVWAYMRTLVSADQVQGRARSSYFAKAGDVIGYTPTQRERANGGEQFPVMDRVSGERLMPMSDSNKGVCYCAGSACINDGCTFVAGDSVKVSPQMAAAVVKTVGEHSATVVFKNAPAGVWGSHGVLKHHLRHV